MNQAVVYQSATISGVAAGTVTENFVTDADTPQALQNWSTGPTSDPDAVVLVPSSAPYWVGWSTPAAGFALLDSPSLDTPQWQPVTTYSPIPMYGTNMQLVSDTDLQSPKDTQYWVVANRRIYNLLIAMPGQTVTISNNGRVSITGTPTTISNGPPWTPLAPVTLYRVTPENTTNSVSYPDGTVLVLAVDIYGKLVTDCTDAIEISCSPTDTNSAGDFHGAGHSAGMTGGIAQLNSTDYGSTFSWGNNDTGGGSPQDPVPSGTKEDIRVWDTYIKPLIKDPITGEPVANPLYSTIGGDGGVNSAQVEVTGED